MAIQLNPSKIPIWKSEQDLQLGLSSDSQKLEEVSNAQERLIHLLFQGIAEDQLSVIGDSVGLSDEETSALVERLRPSLLTNNKQTEPTSSFDSRFAEIIRIGFDTNKLPESVLAKRSKTLIQLQKLDRTGLLLLRALIEVGFRKFETCDYGTVQREDCGELGFGEADLGISRLTAARYLLHGKLGDVHLAHLARRKSNRLVLLSAMHQLSPTDYLGQINPHIAIEYGISNLRITPVVIPGKTPCLKCRALWQVEQQGDWVGTSIQLASRRDHLDDAAALLLAAATACRTICSYLEDEMSTEGFDVELASRSVSPYHWQFHPSCDCR